MLIENTLYKKDIDLIINTFSQKWESFRNTHILITGATGLIGSCLVNAFLYADKRMNLGLQVYILARKEDKVYKLFGEDSNKLHIIIGTVENFNDTSNHFDFIIHAASQTSSKGFMTNPVETFKTSVLGTSNLLNCAKNNKVRKFVFLSTMEVYGTPNDDRKIDENTKLEVLTSSVRNCYPISKIASENLCCDYSHEYGFHSAVLRLTQTFGPGVSYLDGRVFAEFLRCAIEAKDIVLKTKGETKRSYLYTADAVLAILTVLCAEDTTFEIYNVANEETYCSILEMAQLVARYCAHGNISVAIQEHCDISMFGFAPTLHMNLDTSKIKALGWEPLFSFQNMLENTYTFMRDYK